MFPEYRLGLPAPDKDAKPLTFDEMRAAIAKGQRDSALIAQCLRQADYLGLSGEDKYVLLAYQALVHLEDVHKRLMHAVSLMPMPASFTVPSELLGNKP